MTAACRRNDYYAVHKIARSMAGRHRGARKRNFRAVAASPSSAQQWAGRMAKDCKEGGCSATPTSDREMRKAADEESKEMRSDHWAEHMASQDLEGMRNTVWRMRLGRVAPEWSFPVELWRLLLHPLWVNPRRASKVKGIGFEDKQIVPSCKTICMIKNILLRFRKTMRAPIQWHKALAARIGKQNGKEGCSGERIIMIMCTVGRSLCLSMLAKGEEKRSPPLWLYGGIRHRRREAAIAMQWCSSRRLLKYKIPHLMRSHDGVNAFYCLDKEKVSAAVDELYEVSDRAFGQERLAMAYFELSDATGIFTLRNGTGTFPGDVGAMMLFNAVYFTGLEAELLELKEDTCWGINLTATCIDCYKDVDIGTSCFVDDVTDKVLEVGAGDLLSTIAEGSRRQNISVDRGMAACGASQNEEKQENLPFLCGPGAPTAKREMAHCSSGVAGSSQHEGAGYKDHRAGHRCG